MKDKVVVITGASRGIGAEAARVFAAAGARVVEDIDLPRARAAHIHPRDVGGAILVKPTPTSAGRGYWQSVGRRLRRDRLGAGA